MNEDHDKSLLFLKMEQPVAAFMIGGIKKDFESLPGFTSHFAHWGSSCLAIIVTITVKYHTLK